VFVTVKICANDVVPVVTVPKAFDVGLMDSAGAVTPVPLRLELAVSAPAVKVTVALLSPVVAGVKVIETVQLAPPANGAEHVLALIA
jgi:hypothetical protein